MDSKSPFKREGMFAGADPLIFEKARALRKNMTQAETILWFQLKQGINGFKFRRQHPLGIYIADFYCHKAKLVIELDGSIHKIPEVMQNDKARQQSIEERGLQVIRFTNREVLENVHLVLQKVKSYLINQNNSSL
jgi:imidazole glycerol-phosphate synthase subunit HisF